MRIIRSLSAMQDIALKLKRQGHTIGLVPTMGALHEGHLSLIRAAVRENDITVVSIFVNPIQFGAREDFGRYPRTFQRDSAACRRAGVDFIFSPRADQMYPHGFRTQVAVSRLSDVLCGLTRPGHFQGVATVVTKLFNIILPRKAYFGQKDAQQAVIIRTLVKDLNMPLTVKVMPIVRDGTGLALSSRNQYLSARQKKDALVLHAALAQARSMVKAGMLDSRRIIRRMRGMIMSVRQAKIDYLAVVDPENLVPVRKAKSKTLVALAVWIGKTRLIDNMIV